MNKNTLRILYAIHRLEEKKIIPFGNSIAEEAGIAGGTIYPALARLEISGMIESDWVKGDPPRRRAYWTTKMGKAEISITNDPGPTVWKRVKSFLRGVR